MTQKPAPLTREDLQSLSQLPPIKRLNALLDRDDAQEAVRQLAPSSLYHLIREIGYTDAMDLAALASPEQLQTFIDFDAWTRDQFEPEGYLEWLRPLMDLLPLDDLCDRLKDLDPEPLALTLQDHVTVFLYDEDQEVPPEIQQMERPYETMDGVYGYLLPLEDEALANDLRNLIKRLYHADLQLAHRIFESCRWALRSNLQETAYKLRGARMEESGFLPMDEALAIYAWQDPHKARQHMLQHIEDQPTPWRASLPPYAFSLPDLYREQMSQDQDAFFQRALSRLMELHQQEGLPLDLDHLQLSLVSLTNRVMVADVVEPRDLEAAANVFTRVRGLLSLGLEFVSQGQLDTAARLLASQRLQAVFTIGHNLTASLAQQARRLTTGDQRLSLTEDHKLGLLETSDRLLLEGLLQPRPLYVPADQDFARPFESFADMEEAASRLSLLAARLTLLFGLLGISIEDLSQAAYRDHTWPPVELVDLHTALHTAIAQLALGAPEDKLCEPLTQEALLQLLEGPLRRTSQALAAAHDAAQRRQALSDSDLFLATAHAALRQVPTQEAAHKTLAAALRMSVARLHAALADIDPEAIRSGELAPQHLGQALLLVAR